MPEMLNQVPDPMRHGGANWQYREPREPTKELPGTEGKIEIMTKRIASGESCFHPKDENFDSAHVGGHSCRWTFGGGISVEEPSE